MTPDTQGPEYLTVPELAALLRIKERKVYDLAASGDVPCSRATGKLLFPAAEVRAWIAGAQTAPATQVARQPLCLGSHDPLLDWALRQSGSGMATVFDGSGDGLSRFAAGQGAMAGLHIRDAATGEWNTAAVRSACAGQPAVLVSWARRTRGLVLARGLDTGAVHSIADLAGRRVVPRQAGSGTEVLFRSLLSDSALSEGDIDLTDTATSESDAVEAVASGRADAALGLGALAALHGLPFVPLIEERFDLLIDRRAYFEPPLRALRAFTRTPAFADRALGMAGYVVQPFEEVHWNG